MRSRILLVVSSVALTSLFACAEEDPSKLGLPDAGTVVPVPPGWPTGNPGGASDAGAPAPVPGNNTPPPPTNTPPPPASGPANTRFFLPTGEPNNTAAPTVETDAQGGIHTVYPAYARGSAYYSYCAKDCTGKDAVKVVRFETDGTVHNVMLALDAGRPRVLMATAQQIYWASCDGGCTDLGRWNITMILDHKGDREVSGEALALNPQGRPRFIMHTYRAYLGIGQKTPETFLVGCDTACEQPASWTTSSIANQIWEGSHLRYDRAGRAHLATVVNPVEGGDKMGAYVTCAGGAEPCTLGPSWKGIGLMKAFNHMTEVVTIHPTVALAVTRAGGPRVLVLGKGDTGKRNVTYFECDTACNEDHWQGAVVSDHERIGAGIDLALDANDRPRFVYTLDYNIGLAYCDQGACAGPNSKWDLTKIELSRDIPPDQIFLEWNCTISAWFLHDPSLALTAEGLPRVGYQARDISGGTSRPEPNKPRCVAGTDMTWSRMALLPSHKESGI